MIIDIYVTTHQILISQLLSLLLAHGIISHVNVRSQSPYFWRHHSPTHPGFEVSPRMINTLLEVIIDRWIQIGMTDMGQLTVDGDDLRDKIVALVDALLVSWIFVEDTEGKTESMAEDEDEEEENRKQIKQARIERQPVRFPEAMPPKAPRKAHYSRLPLPRTASNRWQAKGNDRDMGRL
ncbi:hypothetical protein L211DRAFT_852893 [Terfezia boudieri ATCC MYA-4762]|uniref:Uncharacterized protein n=1 Tax=Terfezia boudieri ATCC MYA-4762 TaxID=1051890 RepID=A0A3N4LA44_9PEZI|nr:hypothetical protein L211DRAFT_852893 [Terfezia boudieri ATCC MYA-4762]